MMTPLINSQLMTPINSIIECLCRRTLDFVNTFDSTNIKMIKMNGFLQMSTILRMLMVNIWVDAKMVHDTFSNKK